MRLTRQQKWLAATSIAALVLWLWLRDVQPSSTDIQTMQTFTQQMKSHCVGRFLIDAPVGVTDAVGNFGVRIASIQVQHRAPESAATQAERLDAELRLREVELRTQTQAGKAVSRFLGLQKVGEFGRMLVFMTSDTDPDRKVEGYIARDGGVFLFQSSANGDERLTEFPIFLKDIEPHLSIRPEGEIPTTPGFCIDGGLVRSNPKQGENVNSWGWTLPGHEDVSFGFTSRTNDAKVSPGIVDRESQIIREAGNALLMNLRTLRKRRFDLNGMKAQEWSVAVTDSEPQLNLDIEIPGRPNDNGAPAITLSMRVGGQGTHGYQKPSLTEGEALALWDAVIHSLRLRPGAL